MKEQDDRLDWTGPLSQAPANAKLSAEFINQIQGNIEQIVRASGVSFDGTNDMQLAQSITDHALGADYALESGTANNYVLAISGSRYLPNQLAVGYQIRFRTGNANTNTTPTANYGGLGVKTIVAENGTDAIAVGDIKVGVVNTLEYDGTNWRLILSKVNTASETVAGAIKISTSAQMTAGTDDSSAMTPAKVNAKILELFTATKANTGETKDANGFIMKWSSQVSSSGSGLITQSITFATPFPTACVGFFGIVTTTNQAGACSIDYTAKSTTGVTYRIIERSEGTITTPTVIIFAIGY